MQDNENPIENLDDAFEVVQKEETEAQEAAAKEEAEKAAAEAKEKEETEELEKEGIPTDKAPTDWPEEMQEDYNSRVRGFQSSVSKYRNVLEENFNKKFEEFSNKTKEEYEKKFQEAVSSLKGLQKPNNDVEQEEDIKSILADESLSAEERFRKSVQLEVSKALKPLKQENDNLKGKLQELDQDRQKSSQTRAVERAWAETVAEFKELGDETVRNDFVTWCQDNPDRIKGCATFQDMYRRYAFPKQREMGKKEALANLKKKASESVETTTTANIKEERKISSLQDAFEETLKQEKLKENSK